MATLSPRPSATLRSTKYVAALNCSGICVRVAGVLPTPVVTAIAHLRRLTLLRQRTCDNPRSPRDDRSERRAPAESGGDVVESAGLRRAAGTLGPVWAEPIC